MVLYLAFENCLTIARSLISGGTDVHCHNARKWEGDAVFLFWEQQASEVRSLVMWIGEVTDGILV